MSPWFWVFVATYSLNFLLFLSMVFLERKKFTTIVCWTTILTILPIVGYVFYIVMGNGLSIRTRRMINKHKLYELNYNERIRDILLMQENLRAELKDDVGLVKCCYSFGSVLCPGNDVKFYRWGIDKFSDLKRDLLLAKETINMEYYIFADDEAGKEIMNILINKVKEGVKVKFIYDSIGCLGAPRRFFRKLKKAGGEVAEFFPPFAHIRMLNLKMNYRNHRKIVVIDGKIAYTGGMNIRNDHIYGTEKKTSPWRDTHIRIAGSGVYILQNIFLNDWRYCVKEEKDAEDYVRAGYFPKVEVTGGINLQVVESGPDTPIQKIKETYIKMITNAKSHVFIQSPYFVPDDSFLSAIKIALASGVKVGIMIPSKPDHKAIFHVSISYLKELLDLGANVYMFKGFLHSKAMIVDDNKLSIGTCNTDNRSFALNFEDTVIMYSKKLTAQYEKSVLEDIKNSIVVDQTYYKKRRWYTKFLQAVFRLGAPIL